MPKGLQGFQKGNQLGKGRKPTVCFKKGYTPWNKGKKCSQLGDHMRGKSPWNKGIEYKAISGDKNWRWKGGIRVRSSGYIMVKAENHPFCDEQGYVFQHRLIMEESLGRYLDPKEVVHHINHIVNDNRIENLELFTSNGEHLKQTMKGIKHKTYRRKACAVEGTNFC